MSVKTLPLTKPYSMTYLHNAYQLSILGGVQAAFPWIINNFIQISAIIRDSPKIVFHMPNNEGYLFDIMTPFFIGDQLSRDFIIKNSLNILDIICQSIADDKYISFHVNEKHLTTTKAHEQKRNFNHRIMIHAVDYIEKTAFYYGFNNNGIFTENTINIETLSLAYFDNIYDFPRFEDRFHIFKVVDDPGLQIECTLSSIREQLIQYRDSFNYSQNILNYHTNIKCIYGINCIKLVADSIKEKLSNMSPILDIRSIHLLMEHKKLMHERLNHFNRIRPFDELKILASEYNDMSIKYERIRNNMIKYNLKKGVGGIPNIYENLLQLQDMEYTLADRVVSYI